MAAGASEAPYPVQFEAEHPAQQSRWRTALRLPLSLPALVFVLFLQGGFALAISSAILVTGRIPGWLFDWMVSVNRWTAQAGSYLALLTDRYPAFEGNYPIRYDVLAPDRLSRWKVALWKIVTSIPHAIVLVFLFLSLIVVLTVAWFAILITGHFPQGLHSYVSGVFRWGARVQAYALSLTDEFPPFNLSAHATAAGRNSYVLSSAIGLLLTGTAATLFGLIVAFAGQHETIEVSYANLLAAEPGDASQPEVTPAEVGSGAMRLVSVNDPADDSVALFSPVAGSRYVAFTIAIRNWRGANETVPSWGLSSPSGGRSWARSFS